jgi:S-adenosylmethionine synthetase
VYVFADGIVRSDLADRIRKNIDLTPKGIIDKFDLFMLQLTRTTNYGHFGKSDLPWEKLENIV